MFYLLSLLYSFKHLHSNVSCRSCFDVCVEEVAVGSTSPKDSVISYPEQQSEMKLSLKDNCQKVGRGDAGNAEESHSVPQSVNPQQNLL